MSHGVIHVLGVVLGFAGCLHSESRTPAAIDPGLATVELVTEPEWSDDVRVRELLQKSGVAWERIDCRPKDCALGCLPVRCLVELAHARSVEATEAEIAKLRPRVEGDILSVSPVCETGGVSERCAVWPPKPREPSQLPSKRVTRPGPDAPFR